MKKNYVFIKKLHMKTTKRGEKRNNVHPSRFCFLLFSLLCDMNKYKYKKYTSAKKQKMI